MKFFFFFFPFQKFQNFLFGTIIGCYIYLLEPSINSADYLNEEVLDYYNFS